MKRYISLALAVVVLVISFAIPSYAAENQWINVLDYATPNDSGSNTVMIESGDIVHFDVPDLQLGYIDLVVQLEIAGSPTCAVAHEIDSRLNRVKLNDRVYRFYGELDLLLTEGIDLVFNNHPGGTVQFLSMRISTTPYMSYNMPVSGFFSYANGEEVNFYFNSSDDYGGATLYGNSNFSYQDYTGYIQFADWNKYDYIDLQFYSSHLSIASVAATLSDNTVPYEISYLLSESTFGTYLVNITLDLTQIDRDTSQVLELVLTGSVPTIDSQIGYFSVLYCNGLLESSGVGEDLSLWYRIKTFFTDRFAALNTWIDNQTSSITGTIAQWGQKIVDAINPDTGAVDDVVDQSQQQADEIASNNAALQEMPKPDLSGSGDISSIVSVGNTAKYTIFLSRIMTAPVLSDVIMLGLIFSLAAYVLFGKRF